MFINCITYLLEAAPKEIRLSPSGSEADRPKNRKTLGYDPKQEQDQRCPYLLDPKIRAIIERENVTAIDR